MKSVFKKNLIVIIFLFTFCVASAQEGVVKFLYKGTVDKMPVTLYLVEETTGCGPKIYSGMYQYDKLSKWLYLGISDDEENQLVMVEGDITGIISVKKMGKSLQGFWISPDGKKKLDVNLKEVTVSQKVMDTLFEKFDQVAYEMNDC